MYIFNKRFYNSFYTIVLLMVCLTTSINAQLQTARIFTSGMVLQRDVEIPVWGTTDPCDTVIVTLNLQGDTAYADAEGKWQAILPVMIAGGPYTMTIDNGNTVLTRTSVYIGDVWFACGQSNMGMVLSASSNGMAEAVSSNNQALRQFYVHNILNNEPAEDVPTTSRWTPAIPEYARNFTAVGFYFARDLQTEINIPVGIINASVGGGRIETFMSEEMLGFDEQEVRLANGESERQPTRAYNTMIHPLLNYPVKGIIWYQAESNGDNLGDMLSYGSLFKKMITKWRNNLGLGDIPFFWVQLPNYGTAAVESSPGTNDIWPRLRAAQSRALTLPNTGEATSIDVGAVDIHPTRKEQVGHRLSLAALKVAYGEDIVYSGPRYKGHKIIDDTTVMIIFDHVGSGLVAKNTVNDSVHWFSIADTTGTLFPAKAVLYGDSVILWNGQVQNPAVIRYAWEYNPENVNLYNAENLPAVPFLINVNSPGFGISTFTATNTVIERRRSVVLNWKVYGASSITLNDIPYDSIDGIQVWLDDTTTYTLKIVNSLDPNDTASAVITINVIEPLPIIYFKINEGDIVSPETEVNLTATASAPGGGTVEKVEFFVDDALIFTDLEAPYETTWLPTGVGEFNLKAIVTNHIDVSVESATIPLLVTNYGTSKYEAENATRTGGGTVINDISASNRQYVNLTDGWTLTFNNITVPETGEYYLTIRYLLNNGSPKIQNLLINGSKVDSIEFTAPNSSTWMTCRRMVSLNSGDNEIAIEGSWYWMCFDYIAITGEGIISGNDVINVVKQNSVFLQSSPNPFNSSTNIFYSIPESGDVKLEIIDITGKQVSLLINEIKAAGTHITKFDPGSLEDGVYFLKLTFNSFMRINKIIHIK